MPRLRPGPRRPRASAPRRDRSGYVRLLLDACVWGGASATVRGAGHDVIWAGDWIEKPGDDEIIARAAGERRILVTLDKDFGELAVVHRVPHADRMRLVGFSAIGRHDGGDYDTSARLIAPPFCRPKRPSHCSAECPRYFGRDMLQRLHEQPAIFASGVLRTAILSCLDGSLPQTVPDPPWRYENAP